MDDKEAKNIDGIKLPDQQSANSDTNQITINDGSDQQDTSTEVSIDTNGDIAAESVQDTTDNSVESEPANEQSQQQPIATPPLQNDLPPTPAKEDPGIIPSVQPPAPTASPETELVRLREKNKHLKVWLVVLMLLLVGVASALVVYFAQQSKAKNDLKSQQQQNASLQQQLTQQQQNATQKTIDSLNEQIAAEKQKNADLQKTIDEQNKQISSYQTAVKQLLTACGSACNDINVPTASATSNNTTN